MTVSFCGLELAHPVINGSGTFDAIAAGQVFGEQLRERFPFSAYVSKTITLAPRQGNQPPRLWEAPAGLINSIGLPNKGLDRYLSEDLPALAQLGIGVSAPDRPGRGVPLVTNVMGSSAQEISALLDACDEHEQIAAIELNVSCPNVKTGLDIGADPRSLEQVLGAVRGHTRKPLIVKLTPNTADVAACARAAQDGGADAVSLINTLRAIALAPGGRAPEDHRTDSRRRPRWLGGGSGGLSGPAIRSVALAQVSAVAERVSVPVIGMGGVQSAAHARDLIDVGATLVAVGTESFRNPEAGRRIAQGLASS
jgi:dihydroorotate dehydrogenase (NAD+) catalytic subunit